MTEAYNSYFRIGYLNQDGFQPVLILHGPQQTGIWVNADSIPDFNYDFKRKALTLN